MARYENFIIENKVTEFLTSKLAMSQFLTVDTSLEAVDGMIKKIHKYTVTGTAETVTEGNGNTTALSVGYVATPYTVTTSQVKFSYTDEADMSDSYYVDKGIESMAKALVNEYNAAAIAEFEKTTNVVYTGDTTIDFENFVDAIAALNVEDQDETGYFALVNPKTKAMLRKALAADLKYVEAYDRAGYIGSICGVPVYVSKLVADNEVIIANKEAVTCFMKKDVETEQDRVADTRTTNVFARNVKIIALTNESYCVLIKTGTN